MTNINNKLISEALIKHFKTYLKIEENRIIDICGDVREKVIVEWK